MLTLKDKRISLSTDIIEGMKSIKYLCWESIFEQKVNDIRNKEFQYLVIEKTTDGVSEMVWGMLSQVFLYTFLVNYVQNGNDIKNINIYSIITLFSMLVYPFATIPWAANMFNKSRSSFERI